MAEKFLLCRPWGGLNDVLCQVEVCWAYCEKNSRTLVIDFQSRGFPREIFARLVPNRAKIEVIINPDYKFLKKLESRSVFPAELNGRLNSYGSVQREGADPNLRFDLETGVQLSCNLAEIYQEDVLLYERSGGGTASFRALRRLSLTPDAEKEILPFIESLPNHFDSVHVRATDYSTNLKNLARRVCQSHSRTPLLVCSDSNEVLAHSNTTFRDRPVITFGELPTRASEPIHTSEVANSTSESRTQAVRLLAEIFAIGLSAKFFFTFIDNRSRWTKPHFSGLSQLLAFAVSHRHLLSIWQEVEYLPEGPSSPGKTVIVGSIIEKTLFRWRLFQRRLTKAMRKRRRGVKQTHSQFKSA